MGIKVVSGATHADVSRAKPRLSITFTDLTLSVSRVVPVADVSYITLTVSPELDTTGLFKFIPQFVTMVDGTSIWFYKGASDAVVFIDERTFSVGKSVADVAQLLDAIQIAITTLRDFAETATISEAKALTVSKAIADAQALADAVSLAVNKQLDDVPLVADNSTRSSAKALADGVGLNELLAFNYSLAAVIDNVTFAGDTKVLSVGKQLSDSFALIESGVVTTQTYCDSTYFAENYVGYVSYF